MKNVPLLAYVEAIEEAFGRRLGREFVLSPPDFDLARRWHAARLPIAHVLAGIDEAFESGGDPRSLTYCRSFIERLASPNER